MLIDGLRLSDTATVRGIDLEKTLQQPGELVVVVGKAKWYPIERINIKSARAFVGTPAVGASIILSIKKNDIAIAQITIPAGAYITAPITINGIVESTDAITVDVTQVGSTSAGADLGVQLTYESV